MARVISSFLPPRLSALFFAFCSSLCFHRSTKRFLIVEFTRSSSTCFGSRSRPHSSRSSARSRRTLTSFITVQLSPPHHLSATSSRASCHLFSLPFASSPLLPPIASPCVRRSSPFFRSCFVRLRAQLLGFVVVWVNYAPLLFLTFFSFES
jgi:hypothetical protein